MTTTRSTVVGSVEATNVGSSRTPIVDAMGWQLPLIDKLS
jgi:hypothetical protein